MNLYNIQNNNAILSKNSIKHIIKNTNSLMNSKLYSFQKVLVPIYNFKLNNINRKKTSISFINTNPKFTINSDNLDVAKKQIYWRIRNIGQRELEMLISHWYQKYSNTMSVKDLIEFNNEVLNMDNPTMNKYFVKSDSPRQDLKYTNMILKEKITFENYNI